jgi:LPXTG-motif cell wall-anchored protein
VDETTTTTAPEATTTTTEPEPTTTTEPAATTTTTEPEATTTTTEPEATTTTTEPGGGEKPCSPSEGLASHTGISIDKTSDHPSASASFTVKEGCQVVVLLFSGKGNGDENTEFFDVAPEGDPTFGPGDHTLTVDLPDCSPFIVDFFAFSPEPPEAQSLARASADAAQGMAEGDQPPADDPLLDEVIGETTNCPTETSNAEVAPSTILTGGAGSLPKTGSNVVPMLLGGLVLVAGGACALIASRMRSRLTK